MKTQAEIQTAPTETLAVLSISPNDDDHSSLKSIIGHSKWTLVTAHNLFTARASLLQQQDISVVVCESDLMPGSWIDILRHLQSMQQPPSLIVTSRLADDRLWSDVLHRGGWDVLAKPFVPGEVLHSVKLAWDHWRHQTRLPAFELSVIKEAS